MAYTLGQIAEHLKAELHGDPSVEISGIANLASAGSGKISFLNDSKYRADLSTTGASAVILRASDLEHCKTAALVMRDPYVGFALVAQLLDTTPKQKVEIHPSAVVAADAVLGEGVSIGANAVIDSGARIGDDAVIGPGCYIGCNSSVGCRTRLWANCSVYHDVHIGDDCLLQAGAVIGSDGFGYANDMGRWIKIPQLGGVVIGNRVEIGANTCIDRGAIDNTVIEDNVIIDNQCQIAHNVKIGSGSAMAGAAVVAGSTTIGRYCIIGGRSVFNGHISICDGTTIAGATSVMRNIKKPGTYSSGVPEMTDVKWRKVMACLPMLDEIYRNSRKAAKFAAKQKDSGRKEDEAPQEQ
ncbi:MAG: UDP-3-O-(3-hydroxymyristoyl)glucosamine N-acyltransferase [Succinivibrionaceae bacterium]|nr:UDP-3-O-(3-hydroxymyristoyl)glucosamine N-acyltransferase [Succinivibrionaceae bacterium]